jgi:K+-transporting ATPase ATPase A chain
MIRVSLRLLLPLTFLLGLLLLSQGVPQSIPRVFVYIAPTGEERTLLLGPLASWEAIKHLGTNGGGYFAASSAHPFENPTPVTNLLEAGAMLLLPVALPLAFEEVLAEAGGRAVPLSRGAGGAAGGELPGYPGTGESNAPEAGGRRGPNGRSWSAGLGWALALAMLLLFLSAWIPVELGMRRASLDGLELRFGREGSALFTAVTTTATTGSVNSALEAIPPLAKLGALWGMMLNAAFGGDGVGLLNLLSYMVLAVFLASLMAGRTPELFGRKVGVREVALAAGAVLLHPLLVLGPLALAGLSSPPPPPGGGYEQFVRLLWEFASSSANNGSSLALTATPILDVAGALVILFGRYLPLALQLCLAASLAAGRPSEAFATVPLGTPLFVLFLAGVVVILGALTFFPVLALVLVGS